MSHSVIHTSGIRPNHQYFFFNPSTLPPKPFRIAYLAYQRGGQTYLYPCYVQYPELLVPGNLTKVLQSTQRSTFPAPNLQYRN